MSLKRFLLIVLPASLVLMPSITTNAQFTLQKINDRKLYKPTQKGFGVPLRKVEYTSAVNQGILSCQRGNLGILANCVVRNMPLLTQTDPRLDADIKDMGPLGCYDTSIATVILTALANRTNTLPLKGRTKEFAEVPADGNIPKEVERLSWFYRTAKKASKGEKDKNGKLIQSLYFSEVLADFGKINESCDPYIFANCKSATNQYGHAYYEFADGKNWTNDFFIKKMREGYAMFIAYARYVPNISMEKGKPKIKFTLDSVHKVVFSGFQIGNKYPLLINDVGDGMQHRVRLTTDLSERKFVLKGSTKAQSFAETDIIYPPEVKTATFMEYEGEGTGLNDKVYFIVHMDAFKLK
jgi:hypothetical protein